MSSRTEHLPTWWTASFLAALLGLLLLTAWQWRDGAPISANLLELLPGHSSDALQEQAEQRMQEPLNRDLALLVWHPQNQQTLALTAALAAELEGSGLYERVQWQLQPDLAAVREQLLAGRLALLGDAEREQLLAQPQAFVEARVQALFDPFSGSPLVPLEQDWFGLAQAIQNHPPQRARIRIDDSGALRIEHQNRDWALLRARSSASAFDQQQPLLVAAQIAAARSRIEAAGGELLATGGLLYAAHGQQQARQESSLIGGISLLAGIALLLALFRSLRVLAAVLPVLVGVLSGAAACVALFGQIHVLTLVLGASLIGVTLDFPLHYLSKSWGLQPWRATDALRRVLPGLSLALATNLIGYLALAFTPFPALTQVAIFSAAGLLGAFFCTLCLVPRLLNAPLRPWPAAVGFAERWLAGRDRLLGRIGTPWLLGALLLFCAGGILQLNFKDDLRQWIAAAPDLQRQAEQVGEIVGYQPTSQFLLVRAANEEALLDLERQLRGLLDQLVAQERLGGYQALSQLLASPERQTELAAGLSRLAQHTDALLALGVEQHALEAEIAQLQALPVVDIEQALRGPLGEAWRPLWLGGNAERGVASIVSLQGRIDSPALEQLAAGHESVQLVDRPAQLNRLFAQTQIEAAELKLIACVLILALLWLPFGLRGALRCLSIPLLAALAALASLGWLGQPLTLFALFGLLLVTAIGVDYAILMRESIAGRAVSLLGTLLAATTTWLSFGLLALSQTPAVSSFGLAVSLGLLFSFLLAPWAASRQEAPSC